MSGGLEVPEAQVSRYGSISLPIALVEELREASARTRVPQAAILREILPAALEAWTRERIGPPPPRTLVGILADEEEVEPDACPTCRGEGVVGDRQRCDVCAGRGKA